MVEVSAQKNAKIIRVFGQLDVYLEGHVWPHHDAALLVISFRFFPDFLFSFNFERFGGVDCQNRVRSIKTEWTCYLD